jgi:hypothetical protein
MPAVRCCCVPQEVGDAGPSRRIKGQTRGVETSRSRTHACSNFVIQEPELTGASNASTPTRVNQIVRRGSTNPLRRLRQRVVPLQRIQARNSVLHSRLFQVTGICATQCRPCPRRSNTTTRLHTLHTTQTFGFCALSAQQTGRRVGATTERTVGRRSNSLVEYLPPGTSHRTLWLAQPHVVRCFYA